MSLLKTPPHVCGLEFVANERLKQPGGIGELKNAHVLPADVHGAAFPLPPGVCDRTESGSHTLTTYWIIPCSLIFENTHFLVIMQAKHVGCIGHFAPLCCAVVGCVPQGSRVGQVESCWVPGAGFSH